MRKHISIKQQMHKTPQSQTTAFLIYIPRVVNPGSILARLRSVLTTSSLFIYNCKHRSIKFWTYITNFVMIKLKKKVLQGTATCIKVCSSEKRTILLAQYLHVKLSGCHCLMQKQNLNLLQVFPLYCFADHFEPREKPGWKIVSQLCFVDPAVIATNNLWQKVPHPN